MSVKIYLRKGRGRKNTHTVLRPVRGNKQQANMGPVFWSVQNKLQKSKPGLYQIKLAIFCHYSFMKIFNSVLHKTVCKALPLKEYYAKQTSFIFTNDVVYPLWCLGLSDISQSYKILLFESCYSCQ